ncbi:MAG: hypothetical protein PHE33_00100 [Bacteroidales bacterium]|nr:hypothetical protein [Bacteroidales bacterium]
MTNKPVKHPEQNDTALKIKGVSLSAILDTVRLRKDNAFTSRTRVLYNRKAKYYSTKISSQKTLKKTLNISEIEKQFTYKTKDINERF